MLSLYLDVDPRQRNPDEYRLAMRHMLAAVDGQVAREDRERVERFIEREYDRHGRGLILFSCAAEDLWQTFQPMVPVPDTVFSGIRPYIKPLADILDTYGRYAVALVDQEGAQIYLYNLGGLESVTGVVGEDIKRHRQGGWAAARIQRHEDAATYRNLKEAADVLAAMVRSGKARKLILGGSDANVAQFAAMLASDVSQQVVGTISADLSVSPSDLGERSSALIRAVADARRRELVDRLVTAASKGGSAALGLANTLLAVYAGRAYHLVMDAGLEASAYRCDNCGYVGVEEADLCPLCDEPLRLLPDAADSLVRWAISQEIEITFVDGQAALSEAGSVGAFLRY